MQYFRTATRTRGARLALAAVAVALFGLLSMHGWGSHGEFRDATAMAEDIETAQAKEIQTMRGLLES